MKTKQKSSKKGFTLTEILVVVMIVAVLAAVVYPLYTKAITKSRAVEAINLLEMVRSKQIQKYARDSDYFANFTSMGQLTNNLKIEYPLNGGVQLKIKDYTLSLNNATKCMSAQYQKGSNYFTFSSSYENAGLGCSGDVCSSFGDIIGSAQSVCNCGNKECNNGFSLNEYTCNCDCLMECNQSGACYNKVQQNIIQQDCGSGGTQTRKCWADCNGGYCNTWGDCTGQNCNSLPKPDQSRKCGNCGTQSRRVECNTNTGKWDAEVWGACGGEGVCAIGTKRNCGNNNTGSQTCSTSCGWGACTGEKFECPEASKPAVTESCGKCGSRTQVVSCDETSGKWQAGGFGACTGEGACMPGITQKCGNNSTGEQTCSSACAWDPCVGEMYECIGSDSQKCGNCNKGTQKRTCNTSTGKWGSWNVCAGGGECKAGDVKSCGGGNNGNQVCSSVCGWGECQCDYGYELKNGICVQTIKQCLPAEKPVSSRDCAKCGKQEGSVTCDTTTGKWKLSWPFACTNQGECDMGTSRPCGGGNGKQACGFGCKYGFCVCNTGYELKNGTCKEIEKEDPSCKVPCASNSYRMKYRNGKCCCEEIGCHLIPVNGTRGRCTCFTEVSSGGGGCCKPNGYGGPTGGYICKPDQFSSCYDIPTSPGYQPMSCPTGGGYDTSACGGGGIF